MPSAQPAGAGDGLPVQTALRYGTQIADALAHAHERGVVHRDLKSSNVVITQEGRAKVLDFGLAKRVREEELQEAASSRMTLTQAGTVMGTLHYMAPEVLRGEPADGRSDLWALGCSSTRRPPANSPSRARGDLTSARRFCASRRRLCRRGCRLACGPSSSAAWRALPEGWRTAGGARGHSVRGGCSLGGARAAALPPALALGSGR